MLTDAQWEVLAPLIEACRPPHKTEHHNLRRTIEAIVWRHEDGAKWRHIPAELGPWWMAAQTFNRWGHRGVWEHPLDLVQERGGVGRGWLSSMGPASGHTRRRQGRPKRGIFSTARRA